MKILLVDDSAIMLGYLSALLTARGHAVTQAGSMAAALEAAARARPDAIIMDFVLEPGRTGLEALSAIFSLWHGKTPGAPPATILTQGALAALDESRARSLGIGVLQKPVAGREDEFLAAIEAWLGATH